MDPVTDPDPYYFIKISQKIEFRKINILILSLYTKKIKNGELLKKEIVSI